MTTPEYLQREIRRTELSIRRAERKPNTPPEELRGLHEKMEHLKEALKAVEEHWQRVHEQMGWTAGEPLAPEQLFNMEGKPVLLKYRWTEWCIVSGRGEHEIAGDAISFTRRHYGDVCLGLSDYGKTWTAYAYQPAHIDREKWGPCKICGIRGVAEALILKRERFCAYCGRPLTEEAWAELERRCLG